MSNAFSTGTATAPLQPSNAPGQQSLGLGGVLFNTSEAPERLPIGAVDQMLVSKTLPGGTRVVAAFGPDPKIVTWSGKLFGTNIGTRVRQLRLYAVSGQQVALLWGYETYFVVVKSFTPTYMAGYAEYEITVEVVRDLNGAFTIASPATIDQQCAALQAQADAANASIQAYDPVGSAAFQTAYLAVAAAVAAVNPIAQNIVAASTTVIPAVTSAVAAITTYAAGLSTSSAIFATAQGMIASLNAISSNVTRGQSASGVNVTGGSLFQLAAQHYGDVTQAFALAQANGLSSPFLSAAQQTFVALPPLLGQ